MTTPDNPLQSPKPIDLQRALAFLVGWTRQDDAVELIWQDALDDGRGFMLAAALATVFVQAGNLRHDPMALTGISRAVEAIAAMDADPEEPHDSTK